MERRGQEEGRPWMGTGEIWEAGAEVVGNGNKKGEQGRKNSCMIMN